MTHYVNLFRVRCNVVPPFELTECQGIGRVLQCLEAVPRVGRIALSRELEEDTRVGLGGRWRGERPLVDLQHDMGVWEVASQLRRQGIRRSQVEAGLPCVGDLWAAASSILLSRRRADGAMALAVDALVVAGNVDDRRVLPIGVVPAQLLTSVFCHIGPHSWVCHAELRKRVASVVLAWRRTAGARAAEIVGPYTLTATSSSASAPPLYVLSAAASNLEGILVPSGTHIALHDTSGRAPRRSSSMLGTHCSEG